MEIEKEREREAEKEREWEGEREREDERVHRKTARARTRTRAHPRTPPFSRHGRHLLRYDKISLQRCSTSRTTVADLHRFAQTPTLPNFSAAPVEQPPSTPLRWFFSFRLSTLPQFLTKHQPSYLPDWRGTRSKLASKKEEKTLKNEPSSLLFLVLAEKETSVAVSPLTSAYQWWTLDSEAVGSEPTNQRCCLTTGLLFYLPRRNQLLSSSQLPASPSLPPLSSLSTWL